MSSAVAIAKETPGQVPLTERDFSLGEPLPWAVYDVNNLLVLRQGAVLSRAEQIENLIERGVFRLVTATELSTSCDVGAAQRLESVFQRLEEIKTELSAFLETLAGDSGKAAPSVCLDLTARLRRLAWTHADAVLGAILLDDVAPYTQVHPVLVGVISELLAARIGLDETLRTSIVAAALTSNVGMLQIQEILSSQTDPLTDDQRRAVHAHPALSRRMLIASGVTDPLWLQIALEHHERVDGTGYPHGKGDSALQLPVRIVAVADIYSAMVLPRKYRSGVHVRAALRDVFAQRGRTVDESLASMLIKEMGVFPPGVFVSLNNCEVGVVIKRGMKKANCPVVSSIVSPRGGAYERPRVRDSGERAEYAISKVVPRVPLGHSLQMIWGMNS